MAERGKSILKTAFVKQLPLQLLPNSALLGPLLASCWGFERLDLCR